jgi:hypothetical protein
VERLLCRTVWINTLQFRQPTPEQLQDFDAFCRREEVDPRTLDLQGYPAARPGLVELHGSKQRLPRPYRLAALLWPDRSFTRSERQVIDAMETADEVFVPAANMQGKDFVAAFVVLMYFLLHASAPGGCRIITTSVRDDHLRVLWGEIGRFLQESRIPLVKPNGFMLIHNHRELRYIHGDGHEDPISFVRGTVSEKGEGMAGHHATFTLAVIDEASGVADIVYDQVRTWAKQILVIGNTLPCENFWKKAVKGGDLVAGQQPQEDDNEAEM